MRVKAEKNRDEEAIQYMRTLAEELKISSATTNVPESTLFPKVNGPNGKPEEQPNKY